MKLKAAILSLTVLVIAGMIVICLRLGGLFEGENYTVRPKWPAGVQITVAGEERER